MKYEIIYTYADKEQHRYYFDNSKDVMRKVSELLTAEIDVKIKIKSTIK